MKLLLLPLLLAASVLAADDLLIADFEGPDYGAWKVEGEAFGRAPARGALPGQMPVTGFRGHGLANSFHSRDAGMGRLVSPPFRIERRWIRFLIGGGGFAGETCMNLLVDGQVVRTATGPNTRPGGSEQLAPGSWEVAEFIGREAVIEIVDRRRGGWGHINVDHIVQSDTALSAEEPRDLVRRLRIRADYLQLPLMRREGGNRGAGAERFSIEDTTGQLLRYVHLEFAPPGTPPEFILSYDVREFRGREVTLRYRSRDPGVLDRLVLNDELIVDPQAYIGPHRPRFHFSPRVGWMNDINGTYFADGLYHVFYQANPTTTARSTGFDMHWGHSVSRDLVHWEEWPIALFPNASGQCYSGTAVITPGGVPGVTEKAAPVLFFTATGPDVPSEQHLATTSDGGRTWRRYAGNPVVPQIKKGNRDPKVLWHAASGHFVMVLYVGDPDTYRFLRSRDLLNWEETSSLAHWFECPEFIPVKSPTTGEDLWLLYGCHRTPPDAAEPFHSTSCYQLGRFDGKTFTPVSKIRQAHLGPNFYAALTFVNQPQGRHIMMGWARNARFPGEIFNQCASVPLELSLRAFGGIDTLCFEPVRELAGLRGEVLNPRSLGREQACDITFHLRADQSATVRVRGLEYHYDAATRRLTHARQTATLHPAATLRVRILIDRAVVETFWNDGEAATCTASLHTDAGPAFQIEGATAEDLIVYSMQSIWPAPGSQPAALPSRAAVNPARPSR